MTPAKGNAAFIALVLIFGAFVPASSAERDSIYVIVTAEDKIYRTDDVILFKISVYNKGKLADADSVEVTLDTHWQLDDIEVTVSSVASGTYQGSYLITNEDHHAWFYVVVTKGTDIEYAELSIPVYQDEFELDVHFDHQNVAYTHPGERLRATLTSTYRDELVDVNEFQYLRLVDASDAITPLEESRISTGVYQVTIDIPETTDGGYYEIEARAQYARTYAEASAYIAVNVLYVWYNLNSIAGYTATFTLGVSDEKGSAIPDAELNIISPQQRFGKTDETGTAIFSITNIHGDTYVYGEVSAQGKSQSFGGIIYTSVIGEVPVPAHWGFDVVPQDDDHWYEPGESVNRFYKAYNCSVPLQNMQIYYYITFHKMDIAVSGSLLWPSEGDHIQGACEIIDAGFATCDSFGAFSINFRAPSEQGFVEIVFECGIPRHEHNYDEHSNPTYDTDDDLVYEEDSDTVFIPRGNIDDSDSISLSSDPLVVGGKTKFTIKPKGGLDFGDEIFANWMATSSEKGVYIDISESEWISWVDGGNNIFLKKNGNGEYEGYTVIPEFISDDGEFTIVAGKLDADSGYADINSVTIKEGEKAGEEPLDVMALILLMAVFVFAFIVIGIGTLITRKDDVHSKGESHETPPPLRDYIEQDSNELADSPPPPEDYVPPHSEKKHEKSP